MTDLQIGLLVIGAAAIAGVVVYNRIQERATRREAERAFASAHPDALLEEPPGRREPTLGPEPSTPVSLPRRATPPSDPRVDYVIDIHGVGEAVLRPRWATLERRFGRRAKLGETEGALQATLQMVNRSGVVSEAELLGFRAAVESMAAAHGAKVSAPPMREALQAAQGLDRACADVDVQVALHVLGPAQVKLGPEAFSVTPRADGLTLLLDVPRTPDLPKSYATMVDTARRLGGRLVDDNGTPLDERSLAAIGAEVESLRGRLAEIGIEPGSPLALRLFS
jgi:hypothetical protein